MNPSKPTVLHVVAGLAAHYGGPSYSVPRLAAAQVELGTATTLVSVADAGQPASDTIRDGYREIRGRWTSHATPVFSRLRLSRGLTRALSETAPTVDVVHNHGLWLMPNVDAANAARRARVPLVLSPRGMLSPEALAFSRPHKAAFWWLLQGPSLRDLACVHATSAAEADEVRAFGITAPIVIVPNGVDLPDFARLGPRQVHGPSTVLYLGRLHPKKSLDVLIAAWAGVPLNMRGGWRLRIVGPSEDGYDRRLLKLIQQHRLENVSIEEPLWGDAKLAAYRAADIFVLPTLNENFGLTVAEALACETPVISTRGAPWSGLLRERCGWWCEHGVRAIAEALQQAMATPPAERRLMGERGRRWMAVEFSWEACASRLLDVYSNLRIK
jgi:glycosyltransferase involved in cell wall biosynthesis